MEASTSEARASATVQPFDYYLVLDFEATCDEGRKFGPPEIIEFPTVAIPGNIASREGNVAPIPEFHYYIRPTVNPKLTNFCMELTGIQQEWVDRGITLKEALDLHRKWMIENRFLPEEGAKEGEGNKVSNSSSVEI